MISVRGKVVLVFALLVVLLSASEALAWGPVTHVKLASDLLSNLWMLPAAVATVIARHRRFFIYGNVATDTVFAKKLSKVKQLCHQWPTALGMLDATETDTGKAFVYGYLAHLAADTVAHNKFLPRQMAVSGSTISFGHLYWEIRADASIERPYLQRLRRSLRGSYDEPEQLLEQWLRRTLLSFRTNRAIFKRMNLLASERGWRRSVEFWTRLSRHDLDHDILGRYHRECLERMADLLAHGESSKVLDEDPNGNAALSYAKAQRKQLRQMKRAGMPHTHIIREATLGHAPKTSRAFVLLQR